MPASPSASAHHRFQHCKSPSGFNTASFGEGVPSSSHTDNITNNTDNTSAQSLLAPLPFVVNLPPSRNLARVSDP